MSTLILPRWAYDIVRADLENLPTDEARFRLDGIDIVVDDALDENRGIVKLDDGTVNVIKLTRDEDGGLGISNAPRPPERPVATIPGSQAEVARTLGMLAAMPAMPGAFGFEGTLRNTFFKRTRPLPPRGGTPADEAKLAAAKAKRERKAARREEQERKTREGQKRG